MAAPTILRPSIQRISQSSSTYIQKQAGQALMSLSACCGERERGGACAVTDALLAVQSGTYHCQIYDCFLGGILHPSAVINAVHAR